MEKISAFTLVDITNTGVSNEMEMNRPEYHQMQNLQMLLQVIGMRMQPLNYRVSILENQDMTSHEFGPMHEGTHKVWRLDFDVDFPSAWHDGNTKFGEFANDVRNVSIVSDLDNTADFSPHDAFDAGPNANVYFKIRDDEDP